MEPHGPYEVPQAELLDLVSSLSRAQDGPESLGVLAGQYGQGGIPQYQVLGDERDPLNYHRRYAARVAYADRQVSRLIQHLRRLKLDDETLLVFTSDHGELLGEHDYYFQHGITLLQAVLHVPLIIVGRGVPPARIVPEPISMVDLMPTVLDLVGLTETGAGDLSRGTSVHPLLVGTEQVKDRPQYAVCQTDRTWCIRYGRYKYTIGEKGRSRLGVLCDLSTDHKEERDRSTDVPEATKDLKSRLEEFRAQAPDLLSPHGGDTSLLLSDEDQRRLKALGYLR
jgi:arylsulfatase A-like enzyme